LSNLLRKHAKALPTGDGNLCVVAERKLDRSDPDGRSGLVDARLPLLSYPVRQLRQSTVLGSPRSSVDNDVTRTAKKNRGMLDSEFMR